MKLEIKHDSELDKISGIVGMSNTQIANILIQKAIHKHQCQYYEQSRKCRVFGEIELSECAFCPLIRM